MPSSLTASQFVAKWSKTDLSERAASHEHFIDLCRLLGQPTPAEHDATGAESTFEKGVTVTDAASKGSGGQSGFADVWWLAKFAWEYKRKGKHKDLTDAYRQLCQYREALENPPLLIVSDIARTEIHTNFTGTAKQVHTIALADIAKPKSLDLLRRAFTDPESFKPSVTPTAVTETVAGIFATLAASLWSRGHDAHAAAHFLMKCTFCLFAEDVGLLPNKLFQRLLDSRKNRPESLTGAMTDLFAQMSKGGSFGVDDVPYFNGGLFDDTPALALEGGEIAALLSAATPDWGSVEPATQLREAESGFRYTATSCFETFPLPWPPGKENTESRSYARISEAAKTLNEQRERWLNPPEWIEPIAKAIDAEGDFKDVPKEARPLIRHSAIMAAAAKDARLKKRTLTNLYNERPTWLKLAHQALDQAVLAAYAEIDPKGGWSEQWAEVWADSGAGQPLPEGHKLKAKRGEIDQHVLENLLRLNLARA